MPTGWSRGGGPPIDEACRSGGGCYVIEGLYMAIRTCEPCHYAYGRVYGDRHEILSKLIRT